MLESMIAVEVQNNLYRVMIEMVLFGTLHQNKKSV